MPAVFMALSELPGYEVTGEYLPDGWQVRYVFRGVVSPADSWRVARRALEAASAAGSMS